MAYDDRIREAIYTSPSGATFKLQFDNVERSGGKKAAVHEFPQQNTASVQDLGNQAERFPMSIYFTGAEYDRQADAFWQALSEQGAGALQHPRYGNIPVLPLSWAQSEQLVEGLGRADFTVDFIRVQTSIVFPITSVSIEQAISANVSAATTQGITEAAAEFVPENAADIAAIKEAVTSGVEDFQSNFAEVLASSTEAQAAANKAVRDIINNIDSLVSEPLALFTSMANLVTIPATIAGSIVSKLGAYGAQIESILASVPATYAQAVAQIQSVFYALGASSIASTIGDMRSRTEAINAADSLEGTAGNSAMIIEAAEAAIPGFRASQEILALLTDSASQARASLLDRAFSLKSERRVKLVTERTPLDLVAEFYAGSIGQLDDFITSNNLQDNEIILIPAGREVVYYA